MAAMTFTEEQTARLLAVLGLAEDTADPETVVMAVEDLAKREAEREAAGAEPSEIAAAAKRLGLGELVDPDTLAALRQDASEGRKLAAAARQADIERQIDDAIRTGRIAPSRRQHWAKLAAADPGMIEVLASIPAETIPYTEVGHSVEPAADDLAESGRWFYD